LRVPARHSRRKWPLRPLRPSWFPPSALFVVSVNSTSRRSPGSNRPAGVATFPAARRTEAFEDHARARRRPRQLAGPAASARRAAPQRRRTSSSSCPLRRRRGSCRRRTRGRRSTGSRG
jgi:hypothetical protein